jgi:FKBP-type peptidyl-prolyl cis-trans isomerase
MNLPYLSFLLVGACASCLALPLTAQEKPTEPGPQDAPAEPAVNFDRALFAWFLGYSRASSLRKTFGPDALIKESRLPEDAFIEGFREGMLGKESPIGEADISRMAREFDRIIAEANRKEAAVSESKANTFFGENGKRPGVVSLPSGIQYEVLTPGSGPLAEPAGGMQIRYETRLLDGTVVETNRPETPVFVTFDQLVEGSRMISLSMPAGAKWRFWVPARLAYGATGNLPKIPPGAAICVEQEVVAIFPPGERPFTTNSDIPISP